MLKLNTWKCFCFFLVSFCFLFIFLSCQHTKLTAKSLVPSLLYVQTSKSGSLKPVKNRPGFYRLVFDQVSENTIYFSDRPFRNVGHQLTDDFVQDWAVGEKSFASVAPNAALDIVDAKLGNLVLIVELFEPKIAKKSGNISQLSYLVKVLSAPPMSSDFIKGKLTVNAQGSIPQGVINKFGVAALFIDSHAPEKAGCNAEDVKLQIHPENMKFHNVVTVCSKSAWGNAENTTACIEKKYPRLSKSCVSCYGKTAGCAKDNCMFSCVNSNSNRCLACVYNNCEKKQKNNKFSLVSCTGLTQEQLGISKIR